MATIKNFYELSPRYDSRKSFYGKAQVIEYDDGSRALKSYDTIVSLEKNGKVEHLDYFSVHKKSPTTSRHQKEFERQFSY